MRTHVMSSTTSVTLAAAMSRRLLPSVVTRAAYNR